MAAPVVVYIDDDEQSARDVQRALYKHLSIKFIKPDEKLDDLMEKIFSFHPDAIIVDFRLSDMILNIEYDGYSVLQQVLEVKDRFPVFILTSNEADAFAEVDDVNFVYEKNQLHGSSTFAERVVKQIDKYKKKLEEKEDRLLELIDKSKEQELTQPEEEELIDLDGFIEKSLDKKSALPDELKVTTNERRLSDILARVDALVEKVNVRLPKP